jgi:hypothetical protein
MGFLRRTPGSERPADGAPRARSGRRSVYEQVYEERATREPEAAWTPVASVDPMTGEFREVPGWQRRCRVGGWRPLDELLSDRRRDPLADLERDRGPL